MGAAFKETKLPADAPKSQKALAWVDDRFPLSKLWNDQWGKYYAPKNFNIWYIFGSLAMLILVLQIVTGIFLTMHYKPDANLAFDSVETNIMRDVPWGWLVRYMHSTGASAFFIVVYLHMTRGLLYGSYRKPRELIWLFGFAIFLCLMAEAFFGYLLPWGQMSYWGAQVIVNLFSRHSGHRSGPVAVDPRRLRGVGRDPEPLLRLPRDRDSAGAAGPGGGAPDRAARSGLEQPGRHRGQGKPRPGRPWRRHDPVAPLLHAPRTCSACRCFLLIFSAVVFFAPEMGGYFLEYNNFLPADSMKTPPHIAPTWYFTPFYSVLRATTSDFMWVVMAGVAAYVVFIWLRSRLSFKTKVGITVDRPCWSRSACCRSGREVLGRGAVRLVRRDPGPAAVAGPLAGASRSATVRAGTSTCTSCSAWPS